MPSNNAIVYAAKKPSSNEIVKQDNFGRKMCHRSAAKIPCNSEKVKCDHFGRKVCQMCCNILAQAIIVTLGLGRPSAGREV